MYYCITYMFLLMLCIDNLNGVSTAPRALSLILQQLFNDLNINVYLQSTMWYLKSMNYFTNEINISIPLYDYDLRWFNKIFMY